MNVMNLASFFDLDGTLIKGYLMTNFAKHLVLKGLFSKKKFNEIEHWLNLFQNKQVINGQIATNVPVMYAYGIKNQKVQEVKQEAKSFVEEVITNSLYPYTMTLVNIMKQYRPQYMSYQFSEINRIPTSEEMHEVQNYATKLGILWKPVS